MSVTTHTVAQRENLTRIAERYGTTVNRLMELNPEIKNANLIFQGQTLTINKTEDDETGLDTFKRETPTTPTLQTEETVATTPQQTQETQSQEKDYDLAWGIVGGAGAIAAWETGKWAMPHIKSGLETGYLKALYAKDAVVAGTNRALDATGNAARRGGAYIADKAKHLAKGAELEYTFGKDAVKSGVTRATEATSQVVKSGVTRAQAVAESATSKAYAIEENCLRGIDKAVAKCSKWTQKAGQFIMKNGTKVGKFLGKATPWIAGAIALKEVKDANEQGGTEAAVKQAVKSAAGFGGSIAGAKLGAMAGACTGPAAPIAVPVLTIAGGIAGYLFGEKIFS